MAVGLAGQAERINQICADYLDREFPLSVFQRRAAQVKREAMLDEAVRLATTPTSRKMLIWYLDTGPASEWCRAVRPVTACHCIIACIRMVFARLERESRSVRDAPPLVETATQPAGAS